MIKKALAASIALTPCLTLAASLNIAMTSNSDSGLHSDDAITSNFQPEFMGTSEANSTVKISLAGVNFYTKSDSQGLFFWQAMPLRDGAYDLLVESNGESSQLSFIVDTITSVSAESKLENGIAKFWGSSEPNATITIKSNGKTVDSFESNGSWKYSTDTIAPNSMIEISATDIAGNIESQSFVIHDQTPYHFVDAKLSQESDSGVAFDQVTNHQSGLIFKGATSPYSDVTFSLDGELIVTKSDKEGAWSVTSNGLLRDGQFQWNVDSRSPSGDIASLYDSVIIDTYAPNITVGSTLQLIGNDKVKVDGYSSEMASLEITLNGEVQMLTTDSGEWISDEFNGLKVGNSYPVTITATDVAGNVSTVSINCTVVK